MPDAARSIAVPARVLGSVLAVLLLTPSLATAAPLPDDIAGVGRQEAVAVSHQVVVTWRRADLGSTKAQRLAALQRASRTKRVSDAAGVPASFVRPFGAAATMGIYRFEEPLGRDAGRTIHAIAQLPGVEAVEPDPWVTIDALPNDPYANYVWGALGPGDATVYGTATYGVNADDAWSTSTGTGAKVAVIDTGWVAHDDLAGQSLPGYDFISDAWSANDGGGRDSDPSDPGDWISAGEATPFCPQGNSSWHGLHVSGTIAALANNAYGTFGVAPDARIVPVRALGKCGGSMTDIADAVTWARGGTVSGVPANANPVDVINMSLGGPSACPSYLQDAISSARAAGVVVAVAAGNSGGDASTFAPANCAGSLVVAATDIAGKRASYSNYGATVDVAAPGSAIWSTYNAGTTSPAPGDALAGMSGTSMATPHVAAIAALLAAQAPAATAAQIEYAIASGVTTFAADATAHGCSTPGTCGSGIASAPGALAALAAVDADPPVATVTRPAQFTNATSPVWSVAFDEPVTGLSAGDFTTSGTATGCNVQAPGGSGTSWTVAVKSCTEGTVTLTLKADTVADAVGNPGPASSAVAEATTIDRTAPSSAGSVTATQVNGTEVTVQYTAADAASGVATIRAFYATSPALGSPVECASAVSPAASGSLACTIPATDATYQIYTRATDGAGNTEAAPGVADDTVVRDATGPVATVIGPPSPTRDAELGFSIVFNEPPGDFTVDDLAIGGTAADCALGSLSGSGSSWTVALASCGDGGVSLALVAGSVTDAYGNAGPASEASSSTITIDRTAPSVTRPSVTPRKGQKLAGRSVPVTVAWSGADAGGSGIASYALQRSTDGGGTWATVATTAATSVTTTQATSGTVRFRVIATDLAGNQATGATSTTSKASLVQTSGVTFARTWSKQTASRYSGGSTKWSKTRKASATLTFTGRSIALVSTRAATRGKVRIYVGGVLQGTYDLRGATAYRVIAWQRTWTTSRKRTVRIVVLATAGRPRVDVDAFVVLK